MIRTTDGKRCYVCDEPVADEATTCRACGSVATYRGRRMPRHIMGPPLPEDLDVLPGAPARHRRRGRGPDPD